MPHARGKYNTDNTEHPEWHIASHSEQSSALEQANRLLDNWNKSANNTAMPPGENNWNPPEDDLPDDITNIFYMHSADSKGHGINLRVKSEELILAMITRVVESPDSPYRTIADFIRDWCCKGVITWSKNSERIKNDPFLQALAHIEELNRTLDLEDTIDRDLGETCERMDKYIEHKQPRQAARLLLTYMDDRVRDGMPQAWKQKFVNEVFPKYCHLVNLKPGDIGDILEHTEGAEAAEVEEAAISHH